MTPPTHDGSDDVSVPAPFGGPPPPYPQQPSLPSTARPCSWPASLAIGTFTVGVVGVLRFSPFWALVSGLAIAFAVRAGLPDPTPASGVDPHRHATLDAHSSRRRDGVFFRSRRPSRSPQRGRPPSPPPCGHRGRRFTSLSASRLRACVSSGGGTRPRRWWVWLSMASLVILFFAVGGPFRARWAYCESRLTAVVTADEPIQRSNTALDVVYQ